LAHHFPPAILQPSYRWGGSISILFPCSATDTKGEEHYGHLCTEAPGKAIWEQATKDPEATKNLSRKS